VRRSQGYGYVSGQRRAGIRGLESKGRPLWDGASLLRVQPASEVEIAAFRTAEAADADEEVVDGAEGLSVVYLVEAEDEDAETG
jgi:hypothetical protein